MRLTLNLSTLPSRFNPRAPGGARSGTTEDTPVIAGVSIHAPPEGRDVKKI